MPSRICEPLYPYSQKMSLKTASKPLKPSLFWRKPLQTRYLLWRHHHRTPSNTFSTHAHPPKAAPPTARGGVPTPDPLPKSSGPSSTPVSTASDSCRAHLVPKNFPQGNFWLAETLRTFDAASFNHRMQLTWSEAGHALDTFHASRRFTPG